jgi:hypothetical protein
MLIIPAINNSQPLRDVRYPTDKDNTNISFAKTLDIKKACTKIKGPFDGKSGIRLNYKI